MSKTARAIRRSSRRKNKRSEKRHNKWLQRGCLNESRNQKNRYNKKGGSGVFAGQAWEANNVKPVNAIGEFNNEGNIAPLQNGGGEGGVYNSNTNGNHYVLNTQTSQFPLSSNALVEMADKMIGGGSLRRKNANSTTRVRQRRGKNYRYSNKSSRQKGGAGFTEGFTQNLPMHASNFIRGMGDSVGSFIHGLQGDSAPYNVADPTIQPISNSSR